MPDKKQPAAPIAVSDSATDKDKPLQDRSLEPAQPPVLDPEEEAPGGLDVPTGD
jgi:hypothetical protein